MQFADPTQVNCPRCSVSRVQRISDLFGLRAFCPNCGAGLEEHGLRMRALSDESGEFATLLEIVVGIEEVLGIDSISDTELEGVHTLRDIARVVQAYLPQRTDREAMSIDLVRKSAAQVSWCSATDLNFEIPIMDAVDPDRWYRKSSPKSA